MSEPLPITLLALARYAQILGVNPVHFQGAAGTTTWPLKNNRCNDIWPQYSWQYADSVSRYDLAEAIQEAEQDIARELGWWPAPIWISEELRQYPRHYRKGVVRFSGIDVNWSQIGVKAEYGKVIAPGRRAVTAISEGAAVVYTDTDGDGFFETATITVATTLTSPTEIKIYHAGKEAYPGWEIRPVRSKTITGGNVVIVADSWLFIDPDLQGAFPTQEDFGAIDITTVTNYVTTVDVYREYNDTSAVSAQFLWEPKPNASGLFLYGYCGSCTDEGCALTVQNGCLHVKDGVRGIVAPAPATYNATTAQWTTSCFSECREPDMVRVWYQAGALGDYYKGGLAIDPLPTKWAKVIAQLATARLERPFCTCGNVLALMKKWQGDVALAKNDYVGINPNDLNNPFGTRYGEIMAWRQVKRERHIIRGGGAI